MALENIGITPFISTDFLRTRQGLTLPSVTDATLGGSTGSVGVFGNLLKFRSASGTVISLGGGGSGSVTSVALTAPAEFSVGGSPVTTAGTLAITKLSQADNTVWAGPITGGPSEPTFRLLDAADIPAIPNSKLQNDSITITPGAGLSGGGAVALGGSTNLALTSNSITITPTPGGGLTGGGTVALGSSVNLAILAPVSVTNGGTGTTLLAPNAVLTGNSTGDAYTSVPFLSDGTLLIGKAVGAPVAATLTAGAGISVTNGAGSITIAATGAAPNLTTVLGVGNSSGNKNLIVNATSPVLPVRLELDSAYLYWAGGSTPTFLSTTNISVGPSFSGREFAGTVVASATVAGDWTITLLFPGAILGVDLNVMLGPFSTGPGAAGKTFHTHQMTYTPVDQTTFIVRGTAPDTLPFGFSYFASVLGGS